MNTKKGLLPKKAQPSFFKQFRAFRKTQLPHKMDYLGFFANEDKSKAELFANFCSSVYVISSLYAEPQLSECSEAIEKNSISKKEIWLYVCSLETNKSKNANRLPIFFGQ